MPIQKIKSGRIITTAVNDYVGDSGTIFYDETTGDLRLSDGVTPGGIPLLIGGGGGGNGYTGSRGITGYTGSAGSNGFAGSVGYTGSAGSNGFAGSVGYTGSAGSNGFAGSAGSTGFTGSAGIDGFAGSTGYTGSAGSTGFTGSIGLTGSIGYTGSAVEGLISDGISSITIQPGYTLIFPDGSEQISAAPRMYTNADAENGLSLSDLKPGDYYYDDVNASIFICYDTGLGYFDVLDLTVRA